MHKPHNLPAEEAKSPTKIPKKEKRREERTDLLQYDGSSEQMQFSSHQDPMTSKVQTPLQQEYPIQLPLQPHYIIPAKESPVTTKEQHVHTLNPTANVCVRSYIYIVE
jgi:hypothetical protein